MKDLEGKNSALLKKKIMKQNQEPPPRKPIRVASYFLAKGILFRATPDFNYSNKRSDFFK